MSKQKVLFIVFQSPHLANGGLKSLLGILLNFEKIEPVVLTNFRSNFTGCLEEAGIKVILEENRGNKISNLFKLNLAVYKALKEGNIKVVHCNDIDALWWGALAAKRIGAKLIFNIRGVKGPGQKYHWKWRMVNLCDEVIFLSEEMKMELQRRWPGSQSYKHRISYSIAEPEEKHFQKLSLPGRYNFLIPAVIRPLKKQLEFLQFLQAHQTEIPEDWHFHFVGDLNAKDLYCQKCRTLAEQLPKLVTLHGYQSNINQWYQSVYLTLILSEREGLCRGMIESLCEGTPVISFRVISACEILEDHYCGKVVEQGNYESLLKEIESFIKNPVLYSKYSSHGKSIAEELFNTKRVTGIYENAYLED